MLQDRTNVQTLKVTFSSQLTVPRSRLKGFGNHAFSIDLRWWNALPGSFIDCKSIGALKKGLRHICLNLLLIMCNVFSCIFICHVKRLRMFHYYDLLCCINTCCHMEGMSML